MTSYWLVKSEPETYSWKDLVRDKKTDWTGVRNYRARANLQQMERGDCVLFYESMSTKAAVGIARVTKPAFEDKTADEPGWVAVELSAVEPLAKPVTLAQVKAEPSLAQTALVRVARLSVQPLTKKEFEKIISLSRA